MNKAFFINGGAGRVLCSIPALERYAETHEDFIIVSESWHELYLNSSILRDKVFPMGHKDLFEESLKDKKIVSPEPYRINQYFNQKCNLIQAFDIEINELDDIPKTRELKLEINKEDQITGHNLVNEVKNTLGKDKAIVFQPFGQSAKSEGNFIYDSSGRSFEVSNIMSLIEKLNKDYSIILMTQVQIPGWQGLGVASPTGMGLNGWAGVINAADYFLGCDSVGQHFAHAMGKPATVVIGSTFPENISYPENKKFTVIDNGKGKRKYSPIRITMDLCGDRDNEDLMILDSKRVDEIVKSVKNKIGAGKKIKENVGMIGIPTEGKPTFGSPKKVEHNSFKPSFGESFSKDKKKKKPIDELLELEIKKS
tara:strand:+ start:137 stop:1237 length:1101 start_codon:yes stop_codon:yes gene_type:complete